MKKLVLCTAILGIAASTPAFASRANREAHANAMNSIRQGCAEKTGARLDGTHYQGTPAVMTAFKACVGG